MKSLNRMTNEVAHPVAASSAEVETGRGHGAPRVESVTMAFPNGTTMSVRLQDSADGSGIHVKRADVPYGDPNRIQFMSNAEPGGLERTEISLDINITRRLPNGGTLETSESIKFPVNAGDDNITMAELRLMPWLKAVVEGAGLKLHVIPPPVDSDFFSFFVCLP